MRDRRLLGLAMGLCLLLRVVPLAIWPNERCVRDECTYLTVADGFAAGEGMTASAGWLWAPGYPFLVSLHDRLIGWGSAIKLTQAFVSVGTTGLVYLLALRLLRPRRPDGLPDEASEARTRRAAGMAALLYALSPSLAFYTISVWSETLYTTALLGALLALFRARDRLGGSGTAALRSAAAAGALLGVCVLFRGIATYMLPFFATGLLWGRLRQGRAWAQSAALALCAGLVVAPYSVYASQKFDALVVSDRTLGQMMYLGNNGFDPITFDFGNGTLSPRALDRHAAAGRPHCAPEDQTIERDDCERAAGAQWIRMFPAEFLARVPLRVAQMLTPHSLLTRHLRWGHWQGMPQPMKETLVIWGAVWSLGAVWLGAVGLAAWGGGATGATITGLLLYHVAAIAALAGLSRYRAPLEPLLMIFAAAVLVDASGTARRLIGWRRAAMFAALLALVPLTLWFLPAGWTWWRTW